MKEKGDGWWQLDGKKPIVQMVVIFDVKPEGNVFGLQVPGYKLALRLGCNHESSIKTAAGRAGKRTNNIASPASGHGFINAHLH